MCISKNMNYKLANVDYTHEPFAYTQPGVFDDNELAKIKKIVEDKELRDGLIEGSEKDKGIRSSLITHLLYEDCPEIFEKLGDIVNFLNDKFFKFDITEIEPLQYTLYKSETKDKYSTHTDDGYSVNLFRKLSVTIQLSDDKDYTGGDLLFYRHSLEMPAQAPRSKGSIIVFPSFVLHEVTPVTQGYRESLVTWITGPRFK